METTSSHDSSLYSEDLAPLKPEHRSWNQWNLAALWVGMAVCIPTYLLASYMIRSGLSWQAALIIIGLANLVITIPMVLNGHAGVKYGLSFPVAGRAAFGVMGIHLPALIRGFVACGWFGIQTWIGGLAIYSIWNALMGTTPDPELNAGKFICFFIFWGINIFFIWKGTESIRWLEDVSAPILIGIGLILLYWGYSAGGGMGVVFDNSGRLGKSTVQLSPTGEFEFSLITDEQNQVRAKSYQAYYTDTAGRAIVTEWLPLPSASKTSWEAFPGLSLDSVLNGQQEMYFAFSTENNNPQTYSSKVKVAIPSGQSSDFWNYLLWFTSMVGFWATMSISISDITRFAKTQKDQISGQFIGLPGTMIFYSFTGIFVTSAAVIAFPDILVPEDSPWDPVSLMDRFKNPAVIIFAQISMLVATLSTNIAANVIAPANAISNLFPKYISFRMGGVLAGLIGIVLCPWWLLDDISNLLIFISGLLGPVLAVLLCDYFVIRKTNLQVEDLYRLNGVYSYTSGINLKAMVAVIAGALFAVSGKWIPALAWAFSLSWFTGFILTFVVYWLLMRANTKAIKS